LSTKLASKPFVPQVLLETAPVREESDDVEDVIIEDETV
jgi:hypothetical protein